MKKVKVLYLIATLTVGGAERQLVELAKRLPKDSFEPIVCCLTCGGPLVKELEEREKRVVILNKRLF